MPNPAETLLRIESLSVRLDPADGPPRHILEDVGLTLGEGESLGIVGESGSGKSLLARVVMGIPARNARTAVDGSIAFAGTELTALGAKERRTAASRAMGMIFQDPSSTLNPVVRVAPQITEGAPAAVRRSRRARRALALELLEAVGIPAPERVAASFPSQLSGGQRQRVGIAAALATRPRLLLADEPTTALDATVQLRVLDLLDTVRREQGTAMVHITHDLAALSGRTDRIAVMYAGRIVETGPSRAVLTRPRHPYTRALIDSTPRLSAPRRPPLPQIPGGLPELVHPRKGCAFAPRCAAARPTCFDDRPPEEAGPDARHTAACWFPVQQAPDRSEVPA
ncbi:ABC transporter ATP-binding protein [Nocardiopsis composta]|uniref:Oligopeptide/dipeptide ABC transporter ATP-binding protein n=1 Tax=Nocardiopsis composta TaxID=157465 RepID=A0A7W8QIC9_9ACTN|nr:ABC transporter ATP-binding protein [Nocardiopsis composta]MBB5430514.1 oligopeptide/dipeptide ABC transporter ATP-binding protein [Nocardiopsis composta]